MKRKYLAVFVVAVLAVGGLFWRGREQEQPDQQKKGDLVREEAGGIRQEEDTGEQEHKETVYENLDGLYFLSESGKEIFCKQLEAWFAAKALDVEQVRVTGEITADEGIPFEERVYNFYLDCGLIGVEAVYEKGSYVFRETESLSGREDEADHEGKGLTEQEEEARLLQQEYVQVPDGDDPGEVVICNADEVPEHLAGVDSALTRFLEEEGELRRELIYEGKEDGTCVFSFKNPRIDGKGLEVSVREGEYRVQFSP